MKEKTTSGTTDQNAGLNEGNPNTERTPIDTTRIDTGLVGGLNQANYDDEKRGTTDHPAGQNNKREEEG